MQIQYENCILKVFSWLHPILCTIVFIVFKVLRCSYVTCIFIHLSISSITSSIVAFLYLLPLLSLLYFAETTLVA